MYDNMLGMWVGVSGRLRRDEAGMSNTVEILLWCMVALAVIAALLAVVPDKVKEAAITIFDKVVSAAD